MSRRRKNRKPVPPGCRACDGTGQLYDEDLRAGNKTPVADTYKDQLEDGDFWMPRFVPKPPEKKESETVKALCKYRSGTLCRSVSPTDAITDAIKIVKEFENK